jgi:peptidyl-Lys metalloendopeptidase
LIHELSHFPSAGGTKDHCYNRRDCARMAQSDPARAIENADSYQYFTEDVIYYASQPVTGKAAP